MIEAKDMTQEQLTDRICELMAIWEDHKASMDQAGELGDEDGRKTHYQLALRAIGEAFTLTKESERRKRCRV